MKHESTLEVLGAHLQTILASVMASWQSSMLRTVHTLPGSHTLTDSAGQTSNAVSEEPLLKVVLKLTVQAPPALHAYLREVEPLLPLPALDAACRYPSATICCVQYAVVESSSTLLPSIG